MHTKHPSNWLIDAGLLVGFLSITFTGLMLSSWLDLALNHSEPWLTIHILASIGTLILVTFKIVLHWHWIAAVLRKLFSTPTAPNKNCAYPRHCRHYTDSNGRCDLGEYA